MNNVVYQVKTGKAIKKPTGKAPAKFMAALKKPMKHVKKAASK